jgi:protein involved in polysaccharide export with SLBB domain
MAAAVGDAEAPVEPLAPGELLALGEPLAAAEPLALGDELSPGDEVTFGVATGPTPVRYRSASERVTVADGHPPTIRTLPSARSVAV